MSNFKYKYLYIILKKKHNYIQNRNFKTIIEDYVKNIKQVINLIFLFNYKTTQLEELFYNIFNTKILRKILNIKIYLVRSQF